LIKPKKNPPGANRPSSQPFFNLNPPARANLLLLSKAKSIGFISNPLAPLSIAFRLVNASGDDRTLRPHDLSQGSQACADF
jgi:hypothetical protein